MDGRPTSLHVSALSPPEYVAYKDYVDLLATAQSGQSSPLSQQHDMYSSKKIEKSILRDFSLARLGASAVNVDAVMAELPSAGSSRLSPEEIYAFLRVLAHLSRESAVPGERSIHIPPDYVYMPTEPMELVDEDSSVGAAPLESPFDDSNKARPPLPPSRSSKVSRRASMPVPKRKPPPPAPVASGYAPLTDSPKASPTMPQLGAIAQADNSSNNPFRRRHSSQPHPSGVLGKGWPKPAPPLPPRKPSVSNGLPPAPSLPPRKIQHVKNLSSSSSVHSLQSSFTRLGQPTSTAAPSSLMRQSLQAAEKAKSVKSDDPRYIVIKRTGDNQSDGQDTASDAPATPRPVQIRKQVAQALKQAENEQPPPKRVEVTKVVSAKETKKEPQVNGKKDEFATLAKPYLTANPSTTLWNCVDILSGEPKKEPVYAMIILNQPITNKEIFEKAWKASRLHYCADGGANRLHDLLDSSSRPKFMPDMIKGDLDSLRPKVKEYYSLRGVPVVQDKDEYSTDLMKCIEEVEKQEKELSIELPLLLIGGLSGRIDQTVHTMSLLHKLRTKRSHSYVLSGESLAWVLSEGPHLINIDHATMGQTCGILPVGVDKANVRTTGLKWNLDWETSFEGDVSTSNHLLPSEPVIFLHTDKPVLWCVEVTGH